MYPGLPKKQPLREVDQHPEHPHPGKKIRVTITLDFKKAFVWLGEFEIPLQSPRARQTARPPILSALAIFRQRHGAEAYASAEDLSALTNNRWEGKSGAESLVKTINDLNELAKPQLGVDLVQPEQGCRQTANRWRLSRFVEEVDLPLSGGEVRIPKSKRQVRPFGRFSPLELVAIVDAYAGAWLEVEYRVPQRQVSDAKIFEAGQPLRREPQAAWVRAKLLVLQAKLTLRSNHDEAALEHAWLAHQMTHRRSDQDAFVAAEINSLLHCVDKGSLNPDDVPLAPLVGERFFRQSAWVATLERQGRAEDGAGERQFNKIFEELAQLLWYALAEGRAEQILDALMQLAHYHLNLCATLRDDAACAELEQAEHWIRLAARIGNATKWVHGDCIYIALDVRAKVTTRPTTSAVAEALSRLTILTNGVFFDPTARTHLRLAARDVLSAAVAIGGKVRVDAQEFLKTFASAGFASHSQEDARNAA